MGGNNGQGDDGTWTRLPVSMDVPSIDKGSAFSFVTSSDDPSTGYLLPVQERTYSTRSNVRMPKPVTLTRLRLVILILLPLSPWLFNQPPIWTAIRYCRDKIEIQRILETSESRELLIISVNLI